MRSLCTLLTISVCASAQQPKVDLYGDPLPDKTLVRMGTLRLRHLPASEENGFVPRPIFSFDASMIATVNESSVRIWDTKSGKRLREIEINGRILGFLFLPGNHSLVISTSEKVRVYSLKDNKISQEWDRRPIGNRSVYLEYLEQPKTLLELTTSGRVSSLRAWNIDEKKLLYSIDKLPTSFSRYISPDGKQMKLFRVTRTEAVKYSIQSWDLTKQVLLDEIEYPSMFARGTISPDGKSMAIPDFSPQQDGWIVRLVDPSTGKELRPLEGAPVKTFRETFSSDGKTLIVIQDGNGEPEGRVRFFNVDTGKQIREMPISQRFVNGVYPSSDGKLLLAPLHNFGVAVLDAKTGKSIHNHCSHLFAVSHLQFTQDGRTLVSRAPGGQTYSWDVDSGKCLHEWMIDQRNSIHLSAGPENCFVTAGYSEGLRIIDPRTNQLRDTIPLKVCLEKRPNNYHLNISFELSSDNRSMWIFGLDPTTNEQFLWRYDCTSKQLTPCSSWPKSLECYGFLPGNRIAINRVSSAQRDFLRKEESPIPEMNSVIFRDLVLDRQWTFCSHPEQFADNAIPALHANVILTKGLKESYLKKSENTEELVLKQEHTVRVWDRFTGKIRRVIDVPIDPGGQYLTNMACHGRVLACALPKGVLRFWDLYTGKELGKRTGHPVSISSLQFHPNGKSIAVGYGDGTILLWDISDLVPKGELKSADEKQFTQWWNDLGSSDTNLVNEAIYRLIETKETASYFTKQLKPAKPISDRKIEHLLSDLNSQRFAVREKASKELHRILPEIADQLHLVLKGDITAEQKQRIEGLFKSYGFIDESDHLRGLRAMEVLSLSGDPNSNKLIESLAGGWEASIITRHAKSILEIRKK